MRRGKLVVLLLAGILLAATVPAGTATAGSSTTRNDQAHYCGQVGPSPSSALPIHPGPARRWR
jgi:hypothetical protein